MPGVLPHSYSESIVPFYDTDEGEYLITLLRRVWLWKELTQIQCRPSSLLIHAFSSVNIIHRTALFVSHLLGGDVIVTFHYTLVAL